MSRIRKIIRLLYDYYKGNYCELVIWHFCVELRCDEQNK